MWERTVHTRKEHARQYQGNNKIYVEKTTFVRKFELLDTSNVKFVVILQCVSCGRKLSASRSHIRRIYEFLRGLSLACKLVTESRVLVESGGKNEFHERD